MRKAKRIQDLGEDGARVRVSEVTSSMQEIKGKNKILLLLDASRLRQQPNELPAEGKTSVYNYIGPLAWRISSFY